MPNKFWRQFKSGSDIRGIASDGVAGEKINLTNEIIERISLAFATWLANKTWVEYGTMTIAVGTDSRNSAFRIKTAVVSSLRSVGISIYDCGLTSTPAMLMSVSSLSCSAAIEITASHHPANRNGMKFFTKNGGLSSEDIDEILDIAQSEDTPPLASDMAPVKPINMMGYYCNKIKEIILENAKSLGKPDRPLEGLKIAVDAGNGVGGFFVKSILNPLGADTTASIFLEPDGNFPNHVPNPEDGGAIEALSKAVKESGSDLGVMFDTDVDRVGLVDADGIPINRDKLIALVSAIVLEGNQNATIVTDSVTSYKLSEFVQKLGGTHVRYKRGYKNVIDYAKRLDGAGIDCPLAIESSGHAALKDNNFVDDGAYLAAKLICKCAEMKSGRRSLTDLLEDFENAKEQIEIRIPVNDPKVITLSRKVLFQLRKYATQIKGCELEPNSVEGVRLKFTTRWQEGWCILRQSVHDPELVLNIQSYVRHGAASILDLLVPFFGKFSFLDAQGAEDMLMQLKNLASEPLLKVR